MNARRALAAAVIVVSSPVLSSCGANFGAQTDQVYNPSAGVDDRSGQVDVLNALVVSGTSGSGTLIATLVDNSQTRDDSLRNVTGAGGDAAAKVTPGGETTVPAAGLLNLAKDGQIFVASDRVVPGNIVNITFTFANSKAVTLGVPVVSSAGAIYAGIKLPPAS